MNSFIKRLQRNWQTSLIYNTSARHEGHERNTSDTNASRGLHYQHEWDTSDTSATQMWHKCYTNDTSATRVKNFDFDKDTSKNMFSHSYSYFMASERLQEEEKLHFKNYRFRIPRFHAKMRLKSAPQKL